MSEQSRVDVAPTSSSTSTTRPQLRVQRVRPAYQQVADELRGQIVSGRVGSGERLPSEADLGKAFGVSRSTVREALRVLVSQNLIETRRGVSGGSFVSSPDPERVVSTLGATIGVLVETPKLDVEDLLEARLLLEPTATRLATERADAATIETVVAAAGGRRQPEDPSGFTSHLDFHTTVLMATGNLMLTLMGQPVADVLRTRLRRADVDRREWERVDECHREIAAHMAAGDATAAEQEMRRHLEDLRSLYRRAGCW